MELHLTITPDSPQSPTEALGEATALSHSAIKQAMRRGAVRLTRAGSTRRLRRASSSLRPGDELHLDDSEAILAEVPPEPTLISDEQVYSVWHKPYGLRSQGSKWGDHCTVHRWVEQHAKPQRPAFTVHRLDRAATGLMLIAHAKKTAAALARLFESRAVEKHYHAIVHGPFPSSPDPRVVDTPIDGRHALSRVTLLATDPATGRSLLDVEIETGRKHQIRRHLAELGHPVVGDRLHGREGDTVDLQLAAISLAFPCPVTGEPRSYVLPPELQLSL